MPISETTRAEALSLVDRYPVARAALLPLLHLVQSDEGYVSEDGIAFCGEILGLTKAEVGAVATFYTMYKREPFGDYLLSVCTNPTCKIAGGQRIYEAYVDACGGHVDADGAGVMVEHAECLAICDAAPVVQVNYEMYGPLTDDEAADLLDKAKAGDPPASNVSGQVPPTFREVERELSGIDDGVGEFLVEAARRQVTEYDTPPAYRTGETEIPVTHPGGDVVGHGGRAFRADAGLETDHDRQRREVLDRVPDEQREIVEDLAGEGSSSTADLAGSVVDGRQAPPPAAEQPEASGAATPPSAGADAAEGAEDDPSPADSDDDAGGTDPEEAGR